MAPVRRAEALIRNWVNSGHARAELCPHDTSLTAYGPRAIISSPGDARDEQDGERRAEKYQERCGCFASQLLAQRQNHH